MAEKAERIFTEDELNYIKFVQQGFPREDIMKMYCWDERKMDNLRNSSVKKVKISGNIGKFYEHILPTLIEFREKSRPHLLSDEDRFYKIMDPDRKPGYYNLGSVILEYGRVKMTELYDDYSFEHMGFDEKKDMLQIMKVYVFLGLINEDNGYYEITSLGKDVIGSSIEKG